jgi:hypothetical protein
MPLCPLPSDLRPPTPATVTKAFGQPFGAAPCRPTPACQKSRTARGTIPRAGNFRTACAEIGLRQLCHRLRHIFRHRGNVAGGEFQAPPWDKASIPQVLTTDDEQWTTDYRRNSLRNMW